MHLFYWIPLQWRCWIPLKTVMWVISLASLKEPEYVGQIWTPLCLKPQYKLYVWQPGLEFFSCLPLSRYGTTLTDRCNVINPFFTESHTQNMASHLTQLKYQCHTQCHNFLKPDRTPAPSFVSDWQENILGGRKIFSFRNHFVTFSVEFEPRTILLR